MKNDDEFFLFGLSCECPNHKRDSDCVFFGIEKYTKNDCWKWIKEQDPVNIRKLLEKHYCCKNNN